MGLKKAYQAFKQKSPQHFDENEWKRVWSVLDSKFMPNFTRPAKDGPLLYKPLPWVSAQVIGYQETILAKRLIYADSVVYKLADDDLEPEPMEFTANAEPPSGTEEWLIDSQPAAQDGDEDQGE